jgi:hypothetical protein
MISCGICFANMIEMMAERLYLAIITNMRDHVKTTWVFGGSHGHLLHGNGYGYGYSVGGNERQQLCNV